MPGYPVTVSASGRVTSGPSYLQAVVIANRTGGSGTVELIDDTTNNAANHLITLPCPSNDIRGVSWPDGLVLKNGLWLNLTGVTEVQVVLK